MAKKLTSHEHQVLDEALAILKKHNVSEVWPHAPHDVVVTYRGYNEQHRVQGFHDTLGRAIEDAYEKEEEAERKRRG